MTHKTRPEIRRVEFEWGPRHAVSFSDPPWWRPENAPGEKLTMADGSVWFHPYTGGSPTRLSSRGDQT
jgi:hypothetical protein